MEVLKDVLIKEAEGKDKVFIVDNLPKELLYKKAIKLMVDYTNPQQNLVPAFELDDKGRKIPTGEMTEELLPGIELSKVDGAYTFYTDYNEAVERLAAVDRYIESVTPQLDRIPQRVPYAAQPGLSSSAPIARNLIPRVVLPELVSPPVLETAQAPAPRVNSSSTPEAPKDRRIMTEEQKQAARVRMANARASKKPKVA